jgi:IPT/TIG domain
MKSQARSVAADRRDRRLTGFIVTVVAVALAVIAPGAAASPATFRGVASSELTGAPTVTGVFPTYGPVKGGKVISVKGTNLTGATAVYFGAKAATSFTVKNEKDIEAVDPEGTGIVDVTVTTPEGTSATGPEDQFTYNGFPPGISGLSPTKAAAAGNNTVTIKGVNLYGITSVVFGSVSALSFNDSSYKSMTAVAPPETAGKVHVHVTSYYGTSADEYCAVNIPCSVKDIYTFITPTITEVSPNHGPRAGGNEVTITGTGFAPGTTETAVRFGAAHSASVNCSSINTCTAIVPAHGPGSVPVVVIINKYKNVEATAPRYLFE